jgi:RHS repeat-associated protein
MTPSFLSARRAKLVSMGCVAALIGALGVMPAMTYAQAAGVSHESAAVREELSHQLQQPGPSVVSQGGAGGTGAAAPPSGTLVPNLSSAFSDTWSAPHQPMVTRVFQEPVNYKGSDGAWHVIENTLTPSPLGGYENSANSLSLKLPESLGSGVSLGDASGSVLFSLVGAASSLPAVSGNTATYKEVLPSVDLKYVSNATGVRELATLKGSAAPTQLQYSLSSSSGLRAEQQSDGSIALVSPGGAVVFSMPAPMAYPAGESMASGRRLPVSLQASGSGWTLTVDTNEAWVREALASGPVLVDPTTYEDGPAACSLKAESPKASTCSSSELRVGYDSTHQENHSLLNFNISDIPLGATVLSTYLGMYLQAHSTGTAKPVGVYRATKPWTTSATWETYDGTHSWSTGGGDYANPSENSDASVNPSVGASTGWYYWYITKMMQEWVNTANAPAGEGYANEGLIVKDQTDNTTANLLTFKSPSASEYTPYVGITWEPRGVGSEPQYTILSTPLTDKSTMGIDVASGSLMLQSQQLQTAGVAGFGYRDTRTWNGANGEVQDYGHWLDSNDLFAKEYGDGSVGFEDGTGAWFAFQKQSSGAFITPTGIKAVMCAAGSPSPCPSSLPTGVTHELIYDQSQEKVLFGNEGKEIQEDRYGHKVSQEYTSEHTIVWTDPQSHKIEATLGEGGPTELKDISGSRKLTFTYKTVEGQHEPETATEPDGKITSYEYNSSNEISKITDPDGHVTKFAYDGKYRVTEIIRTTNAGHTEGPTTKVKYYEPGEAPTPCTSTQKATVVKDADWTAPKAHETLYCSNVLDEVERTIDANGNQSEAVYNPFGDVTTSTAAAPGNSESGNATSYGYDKTGTNVECVVTGTSTPMSSCPSSPNESALVTSFSYKDSKNPHAATQTQNPEGQSVFACYNEGHQEESSGPSCPTTPSGPAGSPQNETDQLVEQNELKYTYNSNGTISSSTDAAGHITSYEYDEKGNLKKITPPTGSTIGATTITVDADSRPHVITDGAGHIETITYDNDNRATEIVYTGTGAARTVKYEYDGDGNILKRVDPTGTTKYTVDPLSRVTKEELPGSLSNSYEYDAASNMTAFTDGGGTTSYKYNGLSELESMTEPGASKSTTFAYDNDHRLTKLTYSSGASENYKLEPTTGRPETITAEGVSGTTVPKLTYSYKEGKYTTTLTDKLTESTGNSTVYSYDVLDRLKKALTEGTNPSLYEYKLDGAGNRTQQTVNPTAATGGETTYYAYNTGNELECRQTVAPPCSKSSITELSAYKYDEAGNETAITPKSDTSGTTFEYNAANELSSLTPSGGAAQAFSDAGTGQDDLVAIGSATTIQNSQLGLTREVSSAGTSYYARTPNGLLIDQRTPSGNYNPLYDAQGDVIALVNSSGKVERTFRYGPYGENIKSEGTQTVPYPFGFKAGYRAPGGNTGKGNVTNNLIHYGQRYYDPTTGRWTSRDPLNQATSPTGADGFGFADSDPVNEADPGGEISGKGLLCILSVSLACSGNVLEQEGMGDPDFQASPSYEVIFQLARDLEPEEEEIIPAVNAAEDFLASLL